ncbi:MAG: DUF2236 domain-containing protein [Bernardetiaceae bacterium]|nr:DUF2236 domain-containing protein [Bernardetiaceae bacterium]
MPNITDTYLNEARQIGDPLTAELLTALMQTGNMHELYEVAQIKSQENNALPEKMPDLLAIYFEQTACLPDWADTDKIAIATELFDTHALDIMTLLGSMALPYCYAAADGAKVLYFSERMRNDAAKRLFETSQFVFEVMAEDGFLENGVAIRTAQKVRLIHAIARFHVEKQKYWDSAKWGVPINQEDMAGTNLAFSYIIIKGLRKLGHIISQSQADAYIHAWKVCGSLLGIDKTLLPDTMYEAHLLSKHIERRHFRASAEGKALTASLLRSFKETLPPFVPNGYIASYMRFLLGSKISDSLAIPESNWVGKVLQAVPLLNAVKMASVTAFPSLSKRGEGYKRTRQQIIVSQNPNK